MRHYGTVPTPEERLVREFHGRVPADTVAAEIDTAERELRGQVPDGALEEMVYRLVAHRLHHVEPTATSGTAR